MLPSQLLLMFSRPSRHYSNAVFSLRPSLTHIKEMLNILEMPTATSRFSSFLKTHRTCHVIILTPMDITIKGYIIKSAEKRCMGIVLRNQMQSSLLKGINGIRLSLQ